MRKTLVKQKRRIFFVPTQISVETKKNHMSRLQRNSCQRVLNLKTRNYVGSRDPV